MITLKISQAKEKVASETKSAQRDEKEDDNDDDDDEEEVADEEDDPNDEDDDEDEEDDDVVEVDFNVGGEEEEDEEDDLVEAAPAIGNGPKARLPSDQELRIELSGSITRFNDLMGTCGKLVEKMATKF